MRKEPTKSPDFQAVSIVLGNLKTAFSGMHHAFGFAKYSHRYLAQVQYLFNRRFNLRNRPASLDPRFMCNYRMPLRAHQDS